MDEEKPKVFMKLYDVAKFANVTKQSIYLAIRKGKLRALKVERRWEITSENLEEYAKNKYSRKNSRIKGELVFDSAKGELSLQQAREFLSQELQVNVPLQRLYYLMRLGKLKSFKKGGAYVLMKEDVLSILKQEIARRSYLKSVADL